jgi:hypothetical protein
MAATKTSALTTALKTPRPAADCGLCKLPRRAELDQMIRNGSTAEAVRVWLRDTGQTHGPNGKLYHRNSISAHKLNHIPENVVKLAATTRAAVKDLGIKTRLPSDLDLAKIVVERGKERLLDPNDTLDVTLAEALRAQEMIDRRGEKAADRNLFLQLAAVASGAIVMPVIEGEFIEVDAGDVERETWLRQLASGQ